MQGNSVSSGSSESYMLESSIFPGNDCRSLRLFQAAAACSTIHTGSIIRFSELYLTSLAKCPEPLKKSFSELMRVL